MSERRRVTIDDTAPSDPALRAKAETVPYPFAAHGDDAARAGAAGRYQVLAVTREEVGASEAGASDAAAGAAAAAGPAVELVDAIDPRATRAVRIRRTAAAVDAAAAARFLRGATLAARLDHPGVTCVLELGTDADGRAFVVTPRRPAVRLDAWPVTSRGRRVAAVAEICQIIADAHARGVVHNRLGAACIELGETGEIQIGGWDGAAIAADAEASLAALADPAAAPPDPRVDVAALGRILEQVAGGRATTGGERERDRERGRELEPELARLVDAASAAEPLVTSASLARALTRFLDGERDQSLRARVAARHLARARAELADGRRDRAMREARQALALAPSDDDAAALVGRLMLEVPDTLEPGARAAIERSDQEVIRGMGTAVIAAFTAFTCYVPLMFLQGVRSWPTVAAIALMCALMLGWAVRWRAVGPHVYAWPPMIGTAMLMTLYARTFGPFVNAPGELALAAMAVTFFPRGPRAVSVALLFAAPVVGSWLLEQLGVLATTTAVEGGRLVVSSPVVAIAPVPHVIGLAFVSTVLVTVSGGLAGYLVRSQRQMMRRIVAHNWRVRQIAGAAPPGPGRASTAPIAPTGALDRASRAGS